MLILLSAIPGILVSGDFFGGLILAAFVCAILWLVGEIL